MKILWFSNRELTTSISDGSGSWLYAMSDLLLDEVDLYNITEANVHDISFNESRGIKEYLLPKYKLKNGVPSKKNINRITEIVDKISPDVIHIWGIEKYWALLFARGYIKFNPIVEIQGLLSACNDVYWSGLSPLEIIKTLKLKEFLKPSSSLYYRKRKIAADAVLENEMLSKLKVFSTQSQWTRDQIQFVNFSAEVYKTQRPVRREFIQSPKWSKTLDGRFIVFTSLSYYEPFKGIHILLKAIREIKRKYGNVILKIAGPNIKDVSWIRMGGYEKQLLSYISKYNLNSNVEFLGRLSASALVDELVSADVFVNPSFVESFSASTAEALCVGVPTVISYAGAMPEFTEEVKTALCYSPMDYKSCAAKIEALYINTELSSRLSQNAIEFIRSRCSAQSVKNTQLQIYRDYISKITTD